jgi:hypothetical protein
MVVCVTYSALLAVETDDKALRDQWLTQKLADAKGAEPRIVGQGRELLILWYDSVEIPATRRMVYSADSGQTFHSPPQSKLPPTDSISHMALSAGRLHLCWSKPDAQSATETINYENLVIGSDSESSPRRLGSGPMPTGSEMIVSGSNVAVCTYGITSGAPLPIVLAYSTNAGQTFVTKEVGRALRTSAPPSVKFISQDTIACLWSTEEATNKGSWLTLVDTKTGNSSSKRIFTNPLAAIIGAQGRTVVAVQGDTVLVSQDGGRTFQKHFDLDTDLSDNFGFSHTLFPEAVHSDRDVIAVVWESLVNHDIYFSASWDHGVSFSAPVNLSQQFGYSGRPQTNPNVFRVGQKLVVTWFDTGSTTQQPRFLLRSSTDSGRTFEPRKDVEVRTRALGRIVSPQATANDNYVFAVWAEAPSQNAAVAPIWFAKINP